MGPGSWKALHGARIVEGVNETWQHDELTGESYYDLITPAVVGRRVAGSAVRFDSSSTEGHITLLMAPFIAIRVKLRF